MHRQVLIFFPRIFLFLAPFVSSQIDSHILSSEITGNIYVHETSFNRQKYPNHSCLNLMYFFSVFYPNLQFSQVVKLFRTSNKLIVSGLCK